MERFFENDPERENQFFESLNEEELLSELENEGLLDSEGILQIMNIDLAQNEFKHHLINKAVEICEKNLFWRFKNTNTKMREIHTVYEWLRLITEEKEDNEE